LRQFARPTALSDPVGGQPRFAIRSADVNVAAKADDVVKADAYLPTPTARGSKNSPA